jgi:hypothetical protein
MKVDSQQSKVNSGKLLAPNRERPDCRLSTVDCQLDN